MQKRHRVFPSENAHEKQYSALIFGVKVNVSFCVDYKGTQFEYKLSYFTFTKGKQQSQCTVIH